MTKKRVLVGLFGLSRTFKSTSKSLFEKIINPNIENFDFDIVINTDFESNVLTANRPDNQGPISKYKYDDISVFCEELKECYNIQNQLKDIIIYNKETSFIVFPFFVVYKRIQQILKNRYNKNEKYDIYIMLRLDVVINNVLLLNDVKNEIVLVSGDFTRQAYIHDRDIMDAMLYGNYNEFMYWIYSTVQYFKTLTNRKLESLHFFDTSPFCDDSIIQLYDSLNATRDLHLYPFKTPDLEALMNNKNDMDCVSYMRNGVNNASEMCREVMRLVKLNHCHIEFFDHYNFNGACVPINLMTYYGISLDEFIEGVFCNINAILTFGQFSLSENRNAIFHKIIR